MHKPPAILLDVDMVLLNYMHQLERFLLERHGIKAAIPFAEETDYELPHMYPDLAPEDIRRFVIELAQSPDYFGSIPFMPGAEEGVQALRASLPGVPLVCVTSAGEHEITHELRRANLASLAVDEVYVLPLRASKKDVMARFAPGCWFVDDLPRYVAEADSAGHRGVLFHQGYNASAEVERRISGWPELVSLLTAPSPAIEIRAA